MPERNKEKKHGTSGAKILQNANAHDSLDLQVQ